ncbi:MAG TPA: chalcone isomerase family protein [Candidatus Sulfotelmatobacter sp.]|nr:chalcone isomerase family protein [Candidatus Sulfotelmatobacter sp.]
MTGITEAMTRAANNADVDLNAAPPRETKMQDHLSGRATMRKTGNFLAVAMFVVASTFPLLAGTLAGVTLPDTVQVGTRTLLLNGLGLRKKFVVKVYVAGLYLERKSSDPGAILNADVPKRIVMHFVRSVSKSQIADAFDESFENNSPDAKKTLKTEIDQFLGALEPVNDGDQMVLTYLPGTGTTLAINDKEKLTIAAPAFAPALFSVWLGPKPPNADLKNGLLGQ